MSAAATNPESHRISSNSDVTEVARPSAILENFWVSGPGAIRAGQLDWWVKERRNRWVVYAVLTAVNGGSELLTFVP